MRTRSSWSDTLRTCLSFAAFLVVAAHAQQTFVVENNFDSSVQNAATYFGSNYDDMHVWLQFQNTGGTVSYTDSTMHSVVVADYAGIQLSSVLNGAFTVAVGANSTRVVAALTTGTTNPFSSTLAPDPFSVAPPSNYAYALAEFTYLGNVNDNVDISAIDTFAYPTSLTTSSGGTTVATAGWNAGTQAATVVNALSQVMPSGATSKVLTNVSSSDPSAARYVGTSKYLQSGVNFSNTPNATVAYSGPGYNAYLGYLQANAPTYTLPADQGGGTIQGWYLDYSGNNGYSGYLQVTGTSGNYGLQVTNVRANTGALSGQNTNSSTGRALGTAINGTITIAADGSEVTLLTAPEPPNPDSYTMTGPWTDMVISSGAELYQNYNDGFASGPVVTATGDLASTGAYSALTPTFLATISASMTTGLLGSSTFTAAGPGQSSTNYWFGLDGVQANTPLFSSLWSGLPADTYYWDPYIETLVDYSDWQGYNFPFQDRFAALPGTDLNLTGVDTMTWQLGVVAVPEPSVLALFGAGLAAFGMRLRRFPGARQDLQD